MPDGITVKQHCIDPITIAYKGFLLLKSRPSTIFFINTQSFLVLVLPVSYLHMKLKACSLQVLNEQHRRLHSLIYTALIRPSRTNDGKCFNNEQVFTRSFHIKEFAWRPDIESKVSLTFLPLCV